MKSIKMKLKNKYKKPCNYVCNIIKLLTLPQYDRVADFLTYLFYKYKKYSDNEF